MLAVRLQHWPERRLEPGPKRLELSDENDFALLRFLDSRCRPGEAGEHPCPSHDPREGTWEKAEERAERAVEVRAVARTHIESQSPPARLLPVPMCQVSSEVEACTMTVQPELVIKS